MTPTPPPSSGNATVFGCGVPKPWRGKFLPEPQAPMKVAPINRNTIEGLVNSMPVLDVHTHLYDPAFSELLLWGIDELLVYHYLVAEGFRYLDLDYAKFWQLSKVQQADLVWNALFIQHSPISESCRGVLTTLQLLGLDVRKRDLKAVRQWFAAQDMHEHLDRCLNLAGVSRVFMTNSPFDELERPVWNRGFNRDSRFRSGLRIDPLLLSWPDTAKRLANWRYEVQSQPSGKTYSEVQRFLADWTKKIDARYLMVSLPPDFDFPGKNVTAHLLEHAVLPHCREHGLPLALMPGVKRGVNPQLQLAGDGVGLSNLTTVQHLCAQYSDNKFLVTALARESQHELCVLARKFRNLHIFGCWWFTNVPVIAEEMTRMRLELVGLSVTAQQSDARVLCHLVYKWHHTRQTITKVLVEKY